MTKLSNLISSIKLPNGIAYELRDAKAVHTIDDLGLSITAAELNCVEGVTGNIQTQLDTKAAVQIITWEDND